MHCHWSVHSGGGGRGGAAAAAAAAVSGGGGGAAATQLTAPRGVVVKKSCNAPQSVQKVVQVQLHVSDAPFDALIEFGVA